MVRYWNRLLKEAVESLDLEMSRLDSLKRILYSPLSLDLLWANQRQLPNKVHNLNSEINLMGGLLGG